MDRHPPISTEVSSDRRSKLEAVLREHAPVAVALSGGVDSSLLLCEARRVLGDRAVAVTGVSPSLGGAELHLSREIAAWVGAELLEIDTRELDNDAYRANAGDRCFHCKSELYSRIQGHPRLAGYRVVDGTHAEDPAGDRPGMRAAADLGVVAPLRIAGFGKRDIRQLARDRGLPNWERPARPCLASRVAVGTPVEGETLADVEQFEAVLERVGFRIYRARIDRDEVIVEVGTHELARLTEGVPTANDDWRAELIELASGRGYRTVLFDPNGYGRPTAPTERVPLATLLDERR
ncbi:MAG: ATP-dependent sacrificial sulfur transferase LarE [Planctomycetota bacterium]